MATWGETWGEGPPVTILKCDPDSGTESYFSQRNAIYQTLIPLRKCIYIRTTKKLK